MFCSECTDLKENNLSFETAPEASPSQKMGDVMTKEVSQDEVPSDVVAAIDEIGDILKEAELCEMDRAKRIGVELADLSAELGMLAELTDDDQQKAGFSSIFDIAMSNTARGSESSSSSSWSGDHNPRRSRPPRPKRTQTECPKRSDLNISDVSDEGATGDDPDVWATDHTTDHSGSSESSTPKDHFSDAPEMTGEFLLPKIEQEAQKAEMNISKMNIPDELKKMLTTKDTEFIEDHGSPWNEGYLQLSNEEAIKRYLEKNPRAVTPAEEANLLSIICGWRGTDSKDLSLSYSGATRRAARIVQAIADLANLKIPENENWRYRVSLSCSCRLCVWLSETLMSTLRNVVTTLALEPCTMRDAVTILEAIADANNTLFKLTVKGAEVVSKCLSMCGEAASIVCVCKPRLNTAINQHWAVDALNYMLQRYKEAEYFYKLEIINNNGSIGWLRKCTRIQQFLPTDDSCEGLEDDVCDCTRPNILTKEQLLSTIQLYKQSMITWEKSCLSSENSEPTPPQTQLEKVSESTSHKAKSPSSAKSKCEEELVQVQSDGGCSDNSWTSSSSIGAGDDTLARVVQSLAVIEQLLDKLAASPGRSGVERSLSEVEARLLSVYSRLPALLQCALPSNAVVDKQRSGDKISKEESLKQFASWLDKQLQGMSRTCGTEVGAVSGAMGKRLTKKRRLSTRHANTARHSRHAPRLNPSRCVVADNKLEEQLSKLEIAEIKPEETPQQPEDTPQQPEVKPPEKFYYTEATVENMSDTDTVVAEESLETTMHLKDCLNMFANIMINDNTKNIENEALSPPLQTSPIPLFQASKSHRMDAIARLLNRSCDTLEKFKVDVGKQDILSLTPIELGMNLANSKRIPLLLKDVGDIKSDLQKINDLSGDFGKIVIGDVQKEKLENVDPNEMKFASFGVEIKKAISECQSIVQSCSEVIGRDEMVKAIERIEAVEDNKLRAAIIASQKASIRCNDADDEDIDEKDESFDEIYNALIAPKNVHMLAAQIANKIDDIGNGADGESPAEVTTIISSLSDLDNEWQLSKETVKQIRELKMSKQKPESKISKCMKRKVNRKQQMQHSNMLSLYNSTSSGTVTCDHEGVLPDMVGNLYNLSSRLKSMVFEFMKEPNKPELRSLLEEHSAHLKLEEEKDRRFFERCMEEVMRLNMISLLEVRCVFDKKIAAWRQRMLDKHSGIPAQLLNAEINTRTKKFYAYLNESAERVINETPSCTSSMGEDTYKMPDAKTALENIGRGDPIDKPALESTTEEEAAKLPANDELPQKLNSTHKLSYLDIIMRYAMSNELTKFVYESPDVAFKCIAQVQELEYTPSLPEDYHKMSSKQRIVYILTHLQQMHTLFVTSLDKSTFTYDYWLFILNRLDQSKFFLGASLTSVCGKEDKTPNSTTAATGKKQETTPARTATTNSEAVPSGEQLVARGLSLMIKRASGTPSNGSGKKAVAVAAPPPAETVKCKTDQVLEKVEAKLFAHNCQNLVVGLRCVGKYIREGAVIPEHYIEQVLLINSVIGKSLTAELKEIMAYQHKDKPHTCDNSISKQEKEHQNERSKSEGPPSVHHKTQSQTNNVPKNKVQNTTKHVCHVNASSAVTSQQHEHQSTPTTPTPHCGAMPPTCPNNNGPAPPGGTGSCVECRNGEPPCGCCYCTVFGHAPPQTTPVAKNFNETRERLRSILHKKKQMTKEEEMAEKRQNAQNQPPVNNTQANVTQPAQQVNGPPKLPQKIQACMAIKRQQQLLQQQQQQQQQQVPQQLHNKQQNNNVQPATHVQHIPQPPKPQSAATPIRPVSAQQRAINSIAQNVSGNVSANPTIVTKVQMPLRNQMPQPPSNHVNSNHPQQPHPQQHPTNKPMILDPKAELMARMTAPQSSRDSSLDSTSSGYSHRWMEDPRSLDDLLLYIEGPSRPTKAKKRAKKVRQKQKKMEQSLLERRAELEAEMTAARAKLARAKRLLAELNAKAKPLHKKGKKGKNKHHDALSDLHNKEIESVKTLLTETESYLSDVVRASRICDERLSEVHDSMRMFESASSSAVLAALSPRNIPQLQNLKKPSSLHEDILIPEIPKPKPLQQVQLNNINTAPQKEEKQPAKCNNSNKSKDSSRSASIAEVTLTKKQRKELARKQAEECRLAEEKRAKEEAAAAAVAAAAALAAQNKQKKTNKNNNTGTANVQKEKNQPQHTLTNNSNAPTVNKNNVANGMRAKDTAQNPKKLSKAEKKQLQQKAVETPAVNTGATCNNACSNKHHRDSEGGGSSIMHQLSCGIQVGDLKLPPGITLTRVDPSSRTSQPPPVAPPVQPHINSMPIWSRPTPPVQPQPVLLVSTPGEQPKQAFPEPPPGAGKSKKAKKKAKQKLANSAATANALHNSIDVGHKEYGQNAVAPGTKMVTLRNPMFHPNLPPVQISTQPANVVISATTNYGGKKQQQNQQVSSQQQQQQQQIKVPEPIPMPRGVSCQATITPTSNGMYTIRNPMVAAAHGQSPSFPASYVVSSANNTNSVTVQPIPTPQPQQQQMSSMTVSHQAVQTHHPASSVNHQYGGAGAGLAAFNRTSDGYSLFNQQQISVESNCAPPQQQQQQQPPAPIAPPPKPDPIGPPLKKCVNAPQSTQSYRPDNGQYSLFEDSLPYFQRIRVDKELSKSESCETYSFGGAWSYDRQQQVGNNNCMNASGNSNTNGCNTSSSYFTHSNQMNLFADGFGGLSEMIKHSPSSSSMETSSIGNSDVMNRQNDAMSRQNDVMGRQGEAIGRNSGLLYGAIGPRNNSVHCNLSDSGIFTSGSERESYPWEMYYNPNNDK